MLIPLHVKSHYSLGEGTTSIEKLVERAAMLGLPALGLTDAENLYGQVVFHRAAREKGIRPVTGVEIASHLVLLARDRRGYESLSRIVTHRKLRAEPGEDPAVALRGRAAGTFVLTDDPALLERILEAGDVDRDCLRLLLVRPGRRVTDEEKVLAASRDLGIPLVADPFVVFLDPADRSFHALQLAIGRNILVTEVERLGLMDAGGRHFPGPREWERHFADVPGAVEETRRIADGCDLDLTRGAPIFPRIALPDGESAYSLLAKTAFRGLARRRPRMTPRHVERLARELQMIEKLGFCEYFIVVGDIVRFARERGIEVVGRGSGAGSIVAYSLGITNVDPLEHGLYFERFLHEGRADLPDIDVDICWIRRDEVIEHVYEAYGRDRVAMISSHVTFQPHLAFRESLKAFGLPIEHVNRCSRRIPYVHPDIRSPSPLRDLIRSSALAREIPLDEEPFRTAMPLAERLIHQPHHLSIHPGGIVIGDREIEAYVPLEMAAKGIVVTQYDMYSIEDVGLVKIDLLGNRCLTEIQETLDARRRAGESIDLAGLPDGDPKTVELLGAARTIGCFQLESPAMRSLLAKLRVKDIRGCIAAVAIIRPGAAAGGAKEAYIRRARGEEPAAYLDPLLRPILEEAHGVVIYEEDVMCIASAIGGLSLAEGDKLRSALKKCRHDDDILAIENDFLSRSVKAGVAPDVAIAVWQDLRKFASYCFSKAHASGYGVLAYQAAYLKAHFPVEFGCAVLNNHAGMYSTRTISEEVKRMGVEIIAPSVNLSGARFTLEDGRVRIGLGRVKGLSVAALEAILAARRASGPFRSLGDFLRRVPMPRREVEALIIAGAFDDLPPPRGRSERLNQPQLLWELESRGQGVSDDAGPTGWLDIDDGALDHPPLRPYDLATRLRGELDVLEMTVADHPMRLLREEAEGRGYLTTRAALGAAGRRVRVAGLLAATRSLRTQRGEMMRFVTIEDEEGLLEGTLFPRAYQRTAATLRSLGPYVFEGKVEDDRGAVSLTADQVEAW